MKSNLTDVNQPEGQSIVLYYILQKKKKKKGYKSNKVNILYVITSVGVR